MTEPHTREPKERLCMCIYVICDDPCHAPPTMIMHGDVQGNYTCEKLGGIPHL